MPLKLTTLQFGQLETNCYIVSDGAECAVIDPGAADRRLCEAIAMQGCALRWILLTHGHFDHIGGVEQVRAEFPDAKLVINVADADMITSTHRNYSLSTGKPFCVGEADCELSEGAVIPLGEYSFKMLHTPGHTPGSCCYLIEDMLFCGDTIFKGDVGATHFRGGSEQELKLSLSRIMLFNDSVKLFPGHGEATTVGYERIHNGYLR